MVTYSSTYVLVALSIDRYDAIRHPMNFSGSWKRAKVLILAAWSLSFLFSVPIIVFYEEKEIQGILTCRSMNHFILMSIFFSNFPFFFGAGHVQCWIDFLEPWQWQVYMTLISITIFFVPACIITSCYAIIIYTIWSKSSILSHKKTKHKQSKHQPNKININKELLALKYHITLFQMER